MDNNKILNTNSTRACADAQGRCHHGCYDSEQARIAEAAGACAVGARESC